VPSRWDFVDGFPLTPTGKVNKQRLGELLAVRCTTSV
jgi:non-ribosomal peptide synthetase component E (peptide arylation enzyme)